VLQVVFQQRLQPLEPFKIGTSPKIVKLLVGLVQSTLDEFRGIGATLPTVLRRSNGQGAQHPTMPIEQFAHRATIAPPSLSEQIFNHSAIRHMDSRKSVHRVLRPAPKYLVERRDGTREEPRHPPANASV
jgi:hypothetical protein